jgi:hypothetical protein
LIGGLISYLRERIEEKKDLEADIRGDIRVALDAFDYFTETIGLDIADIFQKWRNVPITFMPAHVSNRHGWTERGSLYDLMDDAVMRATASLPTRMAATTNGKSAARCETSLRYGTRGSYHTLRASPKIRGLRPAYERFAPGETSAGLHAIIVRESKRRDP